MKCDLLRESPFMNYMSVRIDGTKLGERIPDGHYPAIRRGRK